MSTNIENDRPESSLAAGVLMIAAWVVSLAAMACAVAALGVFGDASPTQKLYLGGAAIAGFIEAAINAGLSHIVTASRETAFYSRRAFERTVVASVTASATTRQA